MCCFGLSYQTLCGSNSAVQKNASLLRKISRAHILSKWQPTWQTLFFSFLAFLKPADTGTRLALAFTNAWRREKKLHLFYYTSSTPYFSPKSAATVKKKNCGKNVISAVRFFSRLSSSNFLNLLRLQPGLFFYFRLRSFLLFIYPHSQSSFIRRQTAKIAAWNWGQKMFTLFRNSRTTMAC